MTGLMVLLALSAQGTPPPGQGAPADPPDAQAVEDLRQLEALLEALPEALRHGESARLEDHLRRLLLVRERLRRPGALDSGLQESVDQRVLARAGQVLGILRQQRAEHGAAGTAPAAAEHGPLVVLERFALGLAGSPALLGAILGAILLLFLGGVGVGQRRAWMRQPAAQPTPALARAAAALQAPEPARALDVRRARQAMAGGRPLLLSLSYEVKAERRTDYLAYMDRLRDHLVREVGYAYAIWEQDGRPNWFTEMILCTHPLEFDRLAGPDDSATRRLVAGLEEFLKDPARVQRSVLMGAHAAPAAARTAGEPPVRQLDAVLEPDSGSVPIPRPAREAPPGDLAAEAA